MQVEVAAMINPSWCFLAPLLHAKGPALASHCELNYLEAAAKKDDVGTWNGSIVGAKKICTLSIGTKLHCLGGVGPYFPVWMQHIPRTSEIKENTTLESMHW